MEKQDLEKAVSLLPKEVTTNRLFKAIWEAFMNEIPLSVEIADGGLGLSKELYQEPSFQNKRTIFETGIEGHMIDFKVENSDIYVEFSVFNYDNKYVIDFTFDRNKNEKEIHEYIELIIEEEKYAIYKHKTVSLNDFTLENETSKYYYDKQYKLIDRDKIELELDEEFAINYHVPKELARLYRYNFSRFATFLNESKNHYFMDEDDDDLIYDFRPPFLFEHIEEFLTSEYQHPKDYVEKDIDIKDFSDNYYDDEEIDEEELTYLEESIYESENVDDIDEEEKDEEEYIRPIKFNEERKRKCIDFFARNFGTTGEFVLSSSIMNKIGIYLTTKTLKLTTKGLIIKKEDNQYTLYFIDVKEDKYKIDSKIITQEEAYQLFKQDNDNRLTIGLNEFFGEDRGMTL